jgi:hypothetical protein
MRDPNIDSCRTTVFRGVEITGRTKGGRVNETVDGVTSPSDAGLIHDTIVEVGNRVATQRKVGRRTCLLLN